MTTILLIIHLFVTLAMIGVVLIQRSEGGGLGIGTSQGMGSFMGGRGTANLLTRTTAVLATIFMLLSLILALMNRGTAGAGHSVFDTPPLPPAAAPSSSAPASAPPPPAPPSPAPSAPASSASPSSASPSSAPATAEPSATPPAGVTSPTAPEATTPAAPKPPTAPVD